MYGKGSLTVTLLARLSHVREDNDAPGYFEMTLNTKTDGGGALELSARYKTCQEPSTVIMYAVIGQSFYDPGLEWTKTYVLIGALQDITKDPPHDPPCPDAAAFDIRGWVQGSGSGNANIAYTVFDEYEGASYAQNCKVCFGEKFASLVEDGKPLIGQGFLQNLDRLELQEAARPVAARPY